MQRRCWGGWHQTRQTLEKSPTSKLYTTWAHILSDRNVFEPRGEGENGGVQCPRGFLVFSFGGHLPQTSGFRSAKEILVMSFATQPRDFRGVGEQRRGLMPLGLFLFFFWWSLAPDPIFRWFLPRRQDGV